MKAKYVVMDESAVLGRHMTSTAAWKTVQWALNDAKRQGYEYRPEQIEVFRLFARYPRKAKK